MPLSPNLPRLTGTALRLFTSAVEGPARKLLVRKFERELGLDWFRATQVMEPPTLHPVWPVERRAEQGARVWDHELPRRSFESADEGFQYTSVLDYGRAYWEGRTTPLEVAERIIAAFETVQNAIAPFITFDADQLLRDAEASSMRLAGGLGRGPFEGVPVAVKDEFDVAGLPTKVGTAFRNHVAEFDAAAVARMRAGGALLIGKTVMHEYGMGVTGVNVRGGTARNPYAPGHMTGGSSSGSGAIVASGLCPVALGADAGGSIRIPAALCGQFGLKPTFGRISSFGEAPLAWSTACAGPIASTATDLALAYAQLAGPDPNDPLTLEQPRPSLLEWGSTNLENVRIGIPTALFESADPEIARTCEQMLGVFGEHEAQLVPIELPAIDTYQSAHLVTVISEMAHALAQDRAEHRTEMGYEARGLLAVAATLTTDDYLRAQRIRTRLMRELDAAFRGIDVIALPTTAIAAPALRDDIWASGESDLGTALALMQYVLPANFAGLPALSMPAGYTRAGLPIGLQLMGPAWQEHTLLRLAHVGDNTLDRRRPEVFAELMPARELVDG